MPLHTGGFGFLVFRFAVLARLIGHNRSVGGQDLAFVLTCVGSSPCVLGSTHTQGPFSLPGASSCNTPDGLAGWLSLSD
jgi:hypothetical protein